MRAISAVPSAILTTVAEFPMWQPEAQPKERKRTEQKELRFCKKNVKSSVVDPDVLEPPGTGFVISCTDPDPDKKTIIFHYRYIVISF
jgi:hypothetical protein